MKIAEFRDLNLEELKLKYSQLNSELFQIKIKHSLGQLNNSAKLKSYRRNIARLCTLFKEKNLKG